MTTIPIPAIPTPSMGAAPGTTIATAGVLTPSTYSVPTLLRSGEVDGVWLKFTASQATTIYFDTALSVMGPMVWPGASTYTCTIYIGHPAATTLGELREYSTLTASSTSLRFVPDAGQTYYFRFTIQDPILLARPQLVLTTPWAVVLRISSWGTWTDWITPDPGWATFNSMRGIEMPGGYNSNGDPLAWNGSNRELTFARDYVVHAGAGFRSFVQISGSWRNVDPGTVPDAYECAWQHAKTDNRGRAWSPNGEVTNGDTWWGPVGGVCGAVDPTPVWNNASNTGTIGWMCLHQARSNEFNSISNLAYSVYATSIRISLIAALDLMGPLAGYDYDDINAQLWAAGRVQDYWATPASVVYESEMAELLGVDIAPYDQGIAGTISATTATLGTVQWRAAVAVPAGGTPSPGWGPHNETFNANDSGNWVQGGGGPSDIDAVTVCTFAGGSETYYPVPDGVWQAALDGEMAVWSTRKAVDPVMPWGGVTGLDLLGFPSEIDGSAPTTTVPAAVDTSNSVSVGRTGQSAKVRLNLQPSRFKVAIAPVIEPVTPAYPSEIPITGAPGDGRRTFGRPSEAL